MTTENLDTALLKAQASVIGVSKDAKNTFHKYEYTSCESMFREARGLLNSAGLTARRAGWRLRFKHGVCSIRCRMILTHGGSGQIRESTFDFPVIPDKGRPLDKAVSAALSTSLSYWLRDLLCMDRGLEPETVDNRDDRNFVPPKSTPKNTKRKAAPKVDSKTSKEKPKPTSEENPKIEKRSPPDGSSWDELAEENYNLVTMCENIPSLEDMGNQIGRLGFPEPYLSILRKHFGKKMAELTGK